MFNARNPLAYVLWLFFFIGLYFYIFSFVSEEAVWELIKYRDWTYRGKNLSPIGFFINLFFSLFPYKISFLIYKISVFVLIGSISVLISKIHKNLETLPARSMLPYYLYTGMFGFLFLQELSLQVLLGTFFFFSGLLMWQKAIKQQYFRWLFQTGIFFGIASLTHWAFLPFTLLLFLSNLFLGNQRPTTMLRVLRGFLIVALTFFVVLILSGEIQNLYYFSFLYYFYGFSGNLWNFLTTFPYIKLLLTGGWIIIILIALFYIQGIEVNYKIHFRHYETLVFHSVILSALLFVFSQDSVFFIVFLLAGSFYVIEFLASISRKFSVVYGLLLFAVMLSASYLNYDNIQQHHKDKKQQERFLSLYLQTDASVSYIGNKFANLFFIPKYHLQVPMENYKLLKWYLKFNDENPFAYYLSYYCKSFPKYLLIENKEQDLVRQLPLLELIYTLKTVSSEGDKIYVLTALHKKVPCK